MKIIKIIFTILHILIGLSLEAQVHSKSWKNIIFNENDSWYSTKQAKEIAENVLLYQKNNGGWPKNIEMQNKLSISEIEDLKSKKNNLTECTIDNGATTQEMIFLSKIYKNHPDKKYKKAFTKGLKYLLNAQYKNGGWPQFYPLKKGYYTNITYNDEAITNVLFLFKEIIDQPESYPIPISNRIKKKIIFSFKIGIDCILKTQYKQNGILTAWCAQHDENTLLPSKARAFELPSLSGQESAKIVLLLMSIKHPSEDVINAVNNAVKWFEKTKISNIKIETVEIEKGKTDKIVVNSENSEPLWARFMNLDDNRPFFCDRTGVKKYALNEISYERRNGYNWYTNKPNDVLKKYKKWIETLNKTY